MVSIWWSGIMDIHKYCLCALSVHLIQTPHTMHSLCKLSVVYFPSYLTLLSPLGFHSVPPPFLYLYNIHLFLSPSSWTNEFWMCSVWGPKLLPCCSLSNWVLPRCTKCLSWILNIPRNLLCVSWSTALLLPCYYSVRGPGALAGWMGFESVVLLAKVKILDMGGLNVLKLCVDIPYDY